MSSISGVTEKLTPSYTTSSIPSAESPSTQLLISSLGLEKHIEGGYFAEIDRNPLTIPNPFLPSSSPPDASDASDPSGASRQTAHTPFSGNNALRNASTSIYYLLSPVSPQGHFHRNKGRTVHTLIEGRGRYVLIHADEQGGRKRVESFVVGKDVSRGERSVWVVEGEKYKASYLLAGEGDGEGRLLISETVIPGFEYTDHDFLTLEKFKTLVTEEQAEELEWLVRRE